MIEDQLHQLTELPAEVPSGLARKTWLRGRRQRRQQWGAGAAAGVVAITGIAGAAALATPKSQRPTTLTSTAGQGTATASTTAAADPNASIAPEVLALQASEAAANPDLAAITLPDPAPGFPVLRRHDGLLTERFPGRSGLESIWMLAATPDYQTTPGPEAEVTVARTGLFPTTADADGKADDGDVDYAVIGHTTARGEPAIVIRYGPGQIGLRLQEGGFIISVTAGTKGATGTVQLQSDDVPVDQLVALADALQGIPAS